MKLSERTGDDVLMWDKQGHYWGTENGEEWSPNEMLVYATQLEAALDVAMSENQRLTKYVENYEEELGGKDILYINERIEKESAQNENAELKRENYGMRDIFNRAAERNRTGRTERLMFKCGHCKKDTPLLIDALLTAKEPE